MNEGQSLSADLNDRTHAYYSSLIMKIQHLLRSFFPRHIIFKDVLLSVHYVAIEIRLLSLNTIKFRYNR